MSELVSLREFARRKGWNPGYAHKLKAAGRLVVVDGKVDIEASNRLLAESADPARAHLARGSQASAQGEDEESAPPPPVSSSATAPLSGNATFNRAKTAVTVFDARIRELEWKQRSGQLIEVTEASRLAFTAFRLLRDAAQSIGARIKDQCALMSDADRIQQLIDDEIAAVFGSFDPAKVLREDSGDDEEPF